MTENIDELFPGRATIDLDAVKANLRLFQQMAGDAQVMAVVKANAYGHGSLQVALTAIDAGVRWLGVSQVSEAIDLARELERAGTDLSKVTLFSWLAAADSDFSEAIRRGIHLSASSPLVLQQIARSADTAGQCANVHLKIDVGMSRGGAPAADFPALVREALLLSDSVNTVAIWSHLPQADDPEGPGAAVTRAQLGRFNDGVQQAKELGLEPELRHLAATSGAIWHPDTHFDIVRVGIGVYGLSPNPSVATSAELGLRPVMTVSAPLVLVKQLPAGEGVTYGATWRTEQPNWVGLVPLGYADGVPRAASNTAPVTVFTADGPVRTRIVGRVCMDQFVIDLGTGVGPMAEVGDRAVLFGAGPDQPLADDWGEACGTINYEIVTRIAPCVPRIYTEGGGQ